MNAPHEQQIHDALRNRIRELEQQNAAMAAENDRLREVVERLADSGKALLDVLDGDEFDITIQDAMFRNALQSAQAALRRDV